MRETKEETKWDGATRTSTTTTTEKDDLGSSSTSSSTSVGTGGISQSTTTSESVGGHEVSTKETSSLTTGKGRVGGASSTETKDGNVTTKTGREGGVILGPDGSGAYAGTSGEASRTGPGGVKLGVSGGLDGRYTVNVKKVPGSEPPRYEVVTTVSVGAKFGGSSSVEKKNSTGDKGSVSGGASLSGTATATFVHMMSEVDAKAYQAQLELLSFTSPSGAYRELEILHAAVTQGDEVAKAMLTGIQAGLAGDPEAATQLADGDSMSLKLEGEAGVSGKASGSSGSGSIGLGGGASVSAAMSWSVARKGDMVVLTGSPASGTTTSLSGTAGYAGGSMGYGEEHKTSSSRTFVFTLDPTAPDYAQRYRQIVSATDGAQLAAIAAAHPELVSKQSTSEGESEKDTTTSALGPVSMAITEGSARDSTTTVDSSGRSVTETGTGSGGISFSVGGIGVGSYSESGTVSTKVGPDGTATGDVSTTTAETDYGDTWDQIVDKPVDTIIGLFTGGTKPAEDTDVVGMKLTDADYETISGTAGDNKAWDKVLESPRDIEDWNECQARIQAAGGDRERIAEALADFVAGDSSRRAGMVQGIVRTRGTAGGGTRYEWPGDLSDQKAVYAELVEGKPIAAIEGLRNKGDYHGAGRLARDQLARLDALLSQMQAQQGKFTDGAAYAEMLQQIAVRRGELTRQTRLVAAHVAPPAEFTVPTAEQMAGQVEAERAEARARYDGIMQSLAAYLAAQTRNFGAVQAEQAKVDNWFDKPDIYVIAAKLNELRDKVYPQWDSAYQAACEAAEQAGIAKPAEPVPARGWWKHLYDLSFKGW